MKTALIGMILLSSLFGGPSLISDRGASAGSDREQYVRTAEVFGINSIGYMTELGIPNQCWSSDPASEPPVGRIFLQRHDGTWVQNGTGSVVESNRVVVTNAHVVAYNYDRLVDKEVVYLPPERIRFRLYEGTPDDCREVDYDVQQATYGDFFREGVVDRAQDYAVLTLVEPALAYAPQRLGHEHEFNMAVIRKKQVLMVGFPNHPDNNNGLNYAATTCELNFGLYEGMRITHDCDSFPGSSGSPITLILPSNEEASQSRYERIFIAMNTSNAVHPDAEVGAIYSARTINFNVAVHLSFGLSAAIEEAVSAIEGVSD